MRIIIFILLILSIGYYWFILKPQQEYYHDHYVDIQGVYFLKPQSITSFNLIDNQGKKFTKNNLFHHWSLFFFGFTHCQNVCPVTLNVLSQTYKILEKKLSRNELPQVIFVTVDPDADTVKVLNNYISIYNSHFVGARTSIEKTEELEKSFFVTAKKIPETHSFEHSTEIILVNPEGKIQAYFSYPPRPERLAMDYQAILKKQRFNLIPK